MNHNYWILSFSTRRLLFSRWMLFGCGILMWEKIFLKIFLRQPLNFLIKSFKCSLVRKIKEFSIKFFLMELESIQRTLDVNKWVSRNESIKYWNCCCNKQKKKWKFIECLYLYLPIRYCSLFMLCVQTDSSELMNMTIIWFFNYTLIEFNWHSKKKIL